MKSICYIVPYFEKLPPNFQLWLVGCEANPSVNWIVYTDGHSDFKWPKNVKCSYCSFEEVKARIQSFYYFWVDLSRPWRLALMKSAYGEIFQTDIKEFDFGGYCDVDMMWGNIRKFYSEDILDSYDRIGFQGHSTLMRNTEENNLLYRTIIDGETSYKDVFSGLSDYSFDENGMDSIFKYLGKKTYSKINFANLMKYNTRFFLGAFPIDDDFKNKYQVFTWEHGTLMRHFLDYGDVVKTEEFCDIHFWCRPMKFDMKKISINTTYYMYLYVMTDRTMGGYLSKQ